MTDTTPTISGEASFPNVAFGNNAALHQLNAAPTALLGTSTPSDVESETPCRVNQLLVGLREVAAESQPADHANTKHENHLAVVRLGMATSLFYALRAKHAPTASHSLRVALTCSAWAHRLGIDDSGRDRIEVAALLHDIGKIGIPDQILKKPGKLTVEEQLLMDSSAQAACSIVQGCTSDTELLEVIRLSGTWYNSRRFGDSLRGEALPLGARLLSIANAFDSMTTEHVYRRALSRERACEELIDGAGTQFDPELVLDYIRFIEQRPESIQSSVITRWLQQLRPDSVSNLWSATSPANSPAHHRDDRLFFEHLLTQIHDGVAFTDSQGTVTHWNDSLQRITGISRDAILGKLWHGPTLGLKSTTKDKALAICPLEICLRTHAPQVQTMSAKAETGIEIPVQVRVSCVIGKVPGSHGAVIFVRDLSDQANMQQRLESLHQQVTRDALTGIANRAELDRRLSELTNIAIGGGMTFSLIICDIDHFKRVNDTYGHPAGDEALVRFAEVLSSFSRDGDLVARYGGEEFVFLAVGCDNATAAKRAEAIRAKLEKTPLPSLGNNPVTASFGVTQFQAGDRDETILSRADRALLRAKDSGRNRVVRLGSDANAVESNPTKRGWLSWFNGSERRPDRKVDILTPVPVDLAVEKLKGFIADHGAEILTVNENQVSIRINAVCPVGGRRRIDQQISLNAVLTMSEEVPEALERHFGSRVAKISRGSMTKIHVEIKPIRNRDRRRSELTACTDSVIMSLRSYFMGEILIEGDA
jgi:diguanylate cyclase (GGDEF)-like protein/PAS domain S-box-containing protein